MKLLKTYFYVLLWITFFKCSILESFKSSKMVLYISSIDIWIRKIQSLPLLYIIIPLLYLISDKLDTIN